jgi:hypothetical protein
MNKHRGEEIAEASVDAVKAALKPLDYKVDKDSFTYYRDDNRLMLKMEISGINSRTLEHHNFIMYATSRGMNPTWLMKTFVENGYTYMIVGLNTKASKKSVNLIRIDTGQRYKISPTRVMEYMRTAIHA